MQAQHHEVDRIRGEKKLQAHAVGACIFSFMEANYSKVQRLAHWYNLRKDDVLLASKLAISVLRQSGYELYAKNIKKASIQIRKEMDN